MGTRTALGSYGGASPGRSTTLVHPQGHRVEPTTGLVKDGPVSGRYVDCNQGKDYVDCYRGKHYVDCNRGKDYLQPRQPPHTDRLDMSTLGRLRSNARHAHPSLQSPLRRHVTRARLRMWRQLNNVKRVQRLVSILRPSERKHGFSAEPVPVSAYVGSSKSLKELKKLAAEAGPSKSAQL